MCRFRVIGEGESAFASILEFAATRDPNHLEASGIQARASNRIERGEIKYENLSQMPAAAFDVWDYQKYWSPEPVILYSPTRGCYWNKCTFCDYGLNSDAPTSPSRERPFSMALEDLKQATKLGRTFYFAVDAISPSYLRRLSESIVAAGLRIRWGAELRLEASWRRWTLGKLLREAGCVCISFGFESASQRILNLIDKGVSIEAVPAVLEELKDHNIGAQLMGFVGFPSETLGEARATFEFLEMNKDLWTIAGIGEFVLTSGAIVAKHPEKFGIAMCSGCEGDDIVRANLWKEVDNALRGASARERNDSDCADFDMLKVEFDRPFVGGIDSAHSMLYFAKFGRRLLPDNWEESLTDWYRGWERYVSPLDGVGEFSSIADLQEFHAQGRKLGYARSCADVATWLDEVVPRNGGRGGAVQLDISFSGEIIEQEDGISYSTIGALAIAKRRLLQLHGYA